MSKYCPIMSCQDKWHTTQECLGKECAWADKNGNCLIAKALRQIIDPLSCLAQGYPAGQNTLPSQPNYITHWVHKDTTTSPAIDLPHSPSTYTPIDYPYRPIKLKMQGEIEADDN